MKTTRTAWMVYRLRIWAGLGLVTLLALSELWMALRFETGSMSGNPAASQVRPFEVCDIVR